MIDLCQLMTLVPKGALSAYRNLLWTKMEKILLDFYASFT